MKWETWNLRSKCEWPRPYLSRCCERTGCGLVGDHIRPRLCARPPCEPSDECLFTGKCRHDSVTAARLRLAAGACLAAHRPNTPWPGGLPLVAARTGGGARTAHHRVATLRHRGRRRSVTPADRQTSFGLCSPPAAIAFVNSPPRRRVNGVMVSEGRWRACNGAPQCHFHPTYFLST